MRQTVEVGLDTDCIPWEVPTPVVLVMVGVAVGVAVGVMVAMIVNTTVIMKRSRRPSSPS